MAKSSMKIVLIDPLGDVLFSGDSLIGSALAENDDDSETEKQAPTRSGIYPRVKLSVEGEDDVDDGDTRAA